MRQVRDHDRAAVHRYVDGEMDRAEGEAFEARLSEDAGLRAAARELRELRGWFEPERAAQAPEATEGFRDRVRAALFVPEPLAPGAAFVSADTVETWARRILVAAALLIGIGLLVFSGLLRPADSGRLIASPDEVQREIDKLDAAIRRDNALRASEGERR